ncbi:shikimate kinase [Lewinella sp. IMCC34183]|uniref:shikimate kinase n=1 Tax=Lewinella sp. IMCC34183 TaxID=2248762 RepID=UPI000E2245B5|nr:shikimate kinase [Lewinella sp. IMCC34183]
MRLFLTGFMGSGKSYVGRRLADRLGLPFLDLDDLVEEQTKTTIAELFARVGESSFRDLESTMLRELDNLPMFVLATGGGTPCFHDNMQWMNGQGTTVFLDTHPEIIGARLADERDKRPLLHGPEDLPTLIRRRLEDRRECYASAKIHVVHDNPEDDVVRLVESRLNAHRPN